MSKCAARALISRSLRFRALFRTEKLTSANTAKCRRMPFSTKYVISAAIALPYARSEKRIFRLRKPKYSRNDKKQELGFKLLFLYLSAKLCRRNYSFYSRHICRCSQGASMLFRYVKYICEGGNQLLFKLTVDSLKRP